MESLKSLLFFAVTVLIVSRAAVAEDAVSRVTLPLGEYQRLLEQSVAGTPVPRAAPAQFALGSAAVRADAVERDGKVTADVTAEVRVRVLENQWTLVPLLPPGVSVRSATAGGKAVDLLSGTSGLGWGVQTAGDYTLVLQYEVDARFSPSGYLLALPVPAAASITLTALLPAPGLQVSVVPSSGVTTESVESRTRVSATVPTAESVTLAWAVDSGREVALTDARYTGQLENGALTMTAHLSAEVSGPASVRLPLLPSSVTLRGLAVDDVPMKASVEKGYFAALLQGRGTHRLRVEFQVPVSEGQGPMKAVVPVPQAPISKVEVTLPGRKELTVLPATSVAYSYGEKRTIATAFLPMTDRVELSWSEAVPDVAAEEFRAHAAVYHLVHAEEGLLRVAAIGQYDINRGTTNVLRIAIPQGIELSRVESSTGAIVDWRVSREGDGGSDTLEVFLNRQLRDMFPFEIDYDLPLKASEPGAAVTVPLLSPREVSRSRGMVAVLQSRELGLKPVDDRGLTKVGENQIPSEVRARSPLTVGHSYKYGEAAPQLTVQVTAPERRQGKFDTAVSTLSSLSDVALRGTASVEVNVKSGAVEEFVLTLPEGVNVLNLTAPSLRGWRTEIREGRQLIPVQFTQELDGQFRIEVSYEQILGERLPELVIPTISAEGADVEQGRIALEALSAVEVQPAEVQGLSSIDTSELPKQLIMKTTNPILLAYKYVRVDPPVALRVRMTRHREVELQSAVIDSAVYTTLVTEDGVAVTTADFKVRNAREQFLRVMLPPHSEIWSAFVNGEAQKPALAQGQEEAVAKSTGAEYLVKIINSTSGFPVRLTYKTINPPFGWFGRMRVTLPLPQMVVTRSRWQLFLPSEDRWYGEPDSNLRAGRPGLTDDSINVRAVAMDGQSAGALPLPVELPKEGVPLVFEKLYANQTAEESYVSLWYASRALYRTALLLTIPLTVLFWICLVPFGPVTAALPARSRGVIALTLLAILFLASRSLDDSPWTVGATSGAVLAACVWKLRVRLRGGTEVAAAPATPAGS